MVCLPGHHRLRLILVVAAIRRPFAGTKPTAEKRREIQAGQDELSDSVCSTATFRGDGGCGPEAWVVILELTRSSRVGAPLAESTAAIFPVTADFCTLANLVVPNQSRRSLQLASETAVARAVDEERIESLYARAPVALATVVVNSALLIGLLSFEIPLARLLVWGAVLVAITMARAVLVGAYFRNPARFSTRFWEFSFALGAVANGIGWGAGAATFLDTPIEYQVAILFVVGGMVAGASASNATSIPSFAGYTVAAAIPVIGTVMMQGTSSHLLIGTTSLIFVVAMSVMARQGGQVVVEAIRLRIQNELMTRELNDRTRERAGRLQHLLDHAGVVTLIADPQTSTIIDVSRNTESVLGISDKALVGQQLIGNRAIGEIASAQAWKNLVQAASDGAATTMVTLPGQATPPRNRRRHLELSATIRDVQGTEYVLLVVKDNTEQRELESQLAQSHLLASLGTLSAGVAHEINNPLAAVISNLRLMRTAVELAGAEMGPDVDGLIKAPLDDATQSADRIRTTVSNLLATTRASTDPDARTDPRSVIEMLLRVTENETRHRAEVIVDAESTPKVRADPLRLYQALLPIVLQATQAITEGDATKNRITVRIRNEDDRDMVRIDVEDTGPLLTEDQALRIFEPYHSTLADGRGSGLALSVCRRVVSALGGHIQAGPGPTQGAVFTVWLPAVHTDEPKRSANQEQPTTPLPTLDILVVDDDAYVARALVRLLKDHRAEVATEATTALERLKDATFDIVLCDLMMPDMSGMEFYRRLRTLRPELVDRVIFMTGGAFTDAATAFVTEAGRRYLTKPFDMATLRIAMADVLSDRQPSSNTSAAASGTPPSSPAGQTGQ